MIVISRYIEDPQSQTAVTAATRLAQDAAAANILIYALQTDKHKRQRDRAVADPGRHGGLHTQSSNTDIALNAQTIYQDIVSQRLFYTVEYDSSTGKDAQRTITIDSANPVPGVTPGSYEIKLDAPAVEIKAPMAARPSRATRWPTAASIAIAST